MGRRAGVTPEAAEAAGALLLRLDIVSFGGTVTAGHAQLEQLATEATAVLEQLRRESAPSGLTRLKRRSRVVVLGFCCVAQLGAQPAEFSDGVAAYRARRFADAATLFANAAARDPQNPSAWLNLGVVQWMRADTAGAIVAWQRSASTSSRS